MEILQTLMRNEKAVRQGATALRAVADHRDAFVYYFVAQKLDLAWDFNDSQMALDLARRLEDISSMVNEFLSVKAAACGSKNLTRFAWVLNVTRLIPWLHKLHGIHSQLQASAALLDATATVLDHQLQVG